MKTIKKMFLKSIESGKVLSLPAGLRTTTISPVLVCLCLLCCCREQPQAYFLEGVAEPQISLNGQWEVCTHPGDTFRGEENPGNVWNRIEVPGECMMQGYAIQHDQPFLYRKYFRVPEDYQDKLIRLRFDGVYSFARVWVNGHYIREHSGGFTRWECDITPRVQAGDTALLIMEVTDRADEISFASGYAKHPIGGILREVSLLALPAVHAENIRITTDFDPDYQDAVLTVSGKLSETGEKTGIMLDLQDSRGKKVPLAYAGITADGNRDFRITNSVAHPAKWDAEHPNLYSLKVTCTVDGKDLWYKIFRIGFREVEVRGNTLLVNGKEVKLRGACRHDIHPLLGRVSTPEYELLDVQLAKEANINFIRTSHYPPTDNFLSLCDEYGIYVEDETAVCFVGTHRTAAYAPGATENRTDYTERYLSQLGEMLESHLNHPSVIIWSIGNENDYGINFKKSYDLVKATDFTRPVMFSYPGKVPETVRCYDIISMHYPGIHGNMDQYGMVTRSFSHPDMPVIFDEWAHVPCYNQFTVREDPNIRDFWGMSLDSMWQHVFISSGGAGGAIWGMIDETFMLPGTLPGFGEWWGVVDENVIPSGYSGKTVGYGEWGIVDTWRRKKPEFWNTRKAYSPVRLLCTQFDMPAAGSSLSIPVWNRFDHTNLDELTITARYMNRDLITEPVDLEPHTTGTITLPPDEWIPGEQVYLTFTDRKGNMIDDYMITFRAEEPETTGNVPEACTWITEDKDNLTVLCAGGMQLLFDKSSGLLQKVVTAVDTFTLQGPFLNLRSRGPEIAYTYHEIRDHGTGWKAEGFSWDTTGEDVMVSIMGVYEEGIKVQFVLDISAAGKIRLSYRVDGISREYIREMGVKWILEDRYDSLSWRREPYWTNYPPRHLSAPSGKAALYPGIMNIYREKPVKEWAGDSKSFYYDGTDNEQPVMRLTNIARATKENVYDYSLLKNGHKVLSVAGKGEQGCRLARNGSDLVLFINSKLDYVDLGWGNYQRNIMLKNVWTGEAVIQVHP
jgi:hypothetical protein